MHDLDCGKSGENKDKHFVYSTETLICKMVGTFNFPRSLAIYLLQCLVAAQVTGIFHFVWITETCVLLSCLWIVIESGLTHFRPKRSQTAKTKIVQVCRLHSSPFSSPDLSKSP